MGKKEERLRERDAAFMRQIANRADIGADEPPEEDSPNEEPLEAPQPITASRRRRGRRGDE